MMVMPKPKWRRKKKDLMVGALANMAAALGCDVKATESCVSDMRVGGLEREHYNYAMHACMQHSLSRARLKDLSFAG